MGLSIVKALSDAIGANVSVVKPANDKISFLVTFIVSELA